MAITRPYFQTLKRRAVQRFVKENKRSPSEAELKEIVHQERLAYPTVDTVGVSGYDLDRPRFKDHSSASLENTNRQAMWDDCLTLNSRLDSLLETLEDSHKGFQGTSRRVGRLLDETEARLDNLLLLNGAADLFAVGIEETFSTQVVIDETDTDATVESGYVTLGRSGYTPINLSRAKISATSGGTAKILGVSTGTPVSSLKKDDGSLWEYIVYTKEQQGRVSLVLTVDLLNPTYVGDVRLTGLPISVNKKMTTTVFYSIDGGSWTALDPVEAAATPEMNFSIGIDGVQKIQIVLSKDAADSATPNKNSFIYVFSLDSLKIYSDSFKPSKQSVLVAGPYDLLDELGDPVYFTKATFSACTFEPENTSVSFFLSKDKVNWVGVSHDRMNSEIVAFGDSSATVSSDFVNDSVGQEYAVIESVEGLDDIEFSNEAVLNTYCLAAWTSKAPINSFVVKRNIVTSSSAESVLGTPAGWVFDEKTQLYSTTIYVDDPAGRYVDFGTSTAFLNDVPVTGLVLVPQGYAVFATSDTNWIEVDETLTSASDLSKADPLYPYNHKYLIQGYSYDEGFTGEQVYQGFDEYFGRLLSYRSPEEFAYLDADDPSYYSVFTIEDGDGNWYIKVKVDKTDASWLSEQFSANWSIQSGDTNQLYVKALLGTSEKGKTPKIDSFKVRVI